MGLGAETPGLQGHCGALCLKENPPNAPPREHS